MTFKSLGYSTATQTSFTLDFTSPYVEASGQLSIHFQTFDAYTDLKVFINGAQVYRHYDYPSGAQWDYIILPTGAIDQGINTLQLTLEYGLTTIFEDSLITLDENVSATGITFESLGYSASTNTSFTENLTSPYVEAGAQFDIHFQTFDAYTDLRLFINGAQVYRHYDYPSGAQWDYIIIPTGAIDQGINTLQLTFEYGSTTVFEDSLITLNQPPTQPSNVSPVNTATDVSLTPTLGSSAFSDPDTGDTHAASQWQITTTSASYTSPVFDSNVDTSNLTTNSIPSGRLSVSTMYFWHVKYQDSHGNWSAYSPETSFTTTANRVPATPSNAAPASGATGVSVTPTLQSSAFSDPDAGDTHAASQWQITATSGSYTSPVFDSGVDTANKTQITVPSNKLSYNTAYYWHVKYQDSYGNWSAYSTQTSFTTVASGAPNKPVNVLPVNRTTDISLTPTLGSSAFSDPDTGDTHAASQWQITATSGSYTSPMFDSGTDSSNLTSIAIPSGKLQLATTYYWIVRHQDSQENWSAWSAETSFTTEALPNQAPAQPSNVSPANGDTDVSLTPTLSSSAFSDPDSGDTHAASQWQITTSTGDYSSTVLDSGRSGWNRIQYSVPSGAVPSYSTTYYWRVRHQDNHGNWSDYSTETSFTTSSADNGGGDGSTSKNRSFLFYVIGGACGGVVLIGASTGYLWRRRRAAALIAPYMQQLKQWGDEGYDVSDFKRKWLD
jgi:hypothetical protein